MATTEPQASDRAGLFAKMVRVMASMERIPKRGRNSHFSYDFVTDGDVLDAVRAALVEQRIAFFVSFDDVSHRDKGITTGKFTLTFADADTGQTFEVHTVGEGQDTQDKGAAKALTSAVKYALLKTFLISTGEAADDPDTSTGNNGRKPAQPQAPKTQQGPPPATPYLDVSEIGVFDTKAGGKPHIGLMAAGHKWPDIRWWKGRTELLESVPWLAEICTKDELGRMGARFPFAARVYYTMDGEYKVAERFEQLA